MKPTTSKPAQRSVKEIRSLLGIQEQSKLPIVEFCRTHQIHKSTFYYWRNRYGGQREATGQFTLVKLEHPSSEPVLFGEIEFASKTLIRLYQQVDAIWLKSLLQ